MKVYETETVPATTRQKLVCKKCDICGLESKHWKAEAWNPDYYEINETKISIEIRQKNGRSYPEGGSGTEYEIDLCPECFKNKFIPWLRSEGAEVEEQDWDF